MKHIRHFSIERLQVCHHFSVVGKHLTIAMTFKIVTAQKMKFSINDFFCKCDQIRSLLWIWSHLLKKSLMENFIFCAICHLCISMKKRSRTSKMK